MADAVRMTANDSFYSDKTKTVAAGASFETDEEHAKQLEARGLAKRGGAKRDIAPLNKMETPPENKAAPQDIGGPGSFGTMSTDVNEMDTSAVEDPRAEGGEPVPRNRGRPTGKK